jgi:hypothetical protein
MALGRLILTTSLVAHIGACEASARTWRIQANGSGDAPTIQAGIDSAKAGDTILIAPGTYDENLNTKGKGLNLSGTTDPGATIVDGGQRACVLTLDSGGTVERLTLRNGFTLNGGGIYIVGPGPLVIRENVIEDNASILPGGGGGIYYNGNATAEILIESNIIRANTASIGGGLLLGNYGGGVPKLIARGNLIDANVATDRGGGVMGDNVIVTENIISHNYALLTGGGVDVGGDGSEVSANTVAYNITANLGDNGAGITAVGIDVAVMNNLVVGNRSDVLTPRGYGILCQGSSPRCNLLWGNDVDQSDCTADPSNLSADPQFCAVDPGTSMNFLIQMDSPCAPGQGLCGLIGARPVGCSTVEVRGKSWSQVKQLFR